MATCTIFGLETLSFTLDCPTPSTADEAFVPVFAGAPDSEVEDLQPIIAIMNMKTKVWKFRVMIFEFYGTKYVHVCNLIYERNHKTQNIMASFENKLNLSYSKT